MQNAELDEAQAGIKIARRNINNLYMQITLITELGQPGRSVHGVVSELCGGGHCGVSPLSSEPQGR